jgi:hypothetical protein
MKFKSYSTHAWLHKAYNRLSRQEVQLAIDFIIENDPLDKGAFELKVNRMFIDKDKPKNFTVILELLTCCNS